MELLEDRQRAQSLWRRFLAPAGEEPDQIEKVEQKRKATFWFMKAGENVLQRLFDGRGWEMFATDETPVPLKDGQPAFTVPQVAPGQIGRTIWIGNDEHSVGISAGYFQRGRLRLRQGTKSDENHRINNNITGGIKGVGRWFLDMCLMAVTFVVNYGPWEGKEWFATAKEAAEKYYDLTGGDDCPMLDENLPGIGRDKGASQADILDDNWRKKQRRLLRTGAATQVMGSKFNWSRWGSS